jgi:hypothetical protein
MEVAALVVKAKEVVIVTPTTKVEVVEKKQRVKLPKLKMSVDCHGLPSDDLKKSFDARVHLLAKFT